MGSEMCIRDRLKGNLKKFTNNTITSLAQLDEDMTVTRERGFALDRAEYRKGIFSFGAPILNPNGEAIAALGVSVPEVNLSAERLNDIAAAVSQEAASASAKLSV